MDGAVLEGNSINSKDIVSVFISLSRRMRCALLHRAGTLFCKIQLMQVMMIDCISWPFAVTIGQHDSWEVAPKFSLLYPLCSVCSTVSPDTTQK